MEPNMVSDAVRSTLYLEPALHRALRLKAATVHRSMSEIVNDALREALREDEEDLAAFAERDSERPISYEALLAQLKADGTL
jgi:plasmid stability protein